MIKFQYIIVVYIGTEAGNEHYSHIAIDILKGTCEIIMDPHADAQMDCIYFEVCNCMGSGVADIHCVTHVLTPSFAFEPSQVVSYAGF
jgi:hypothetical protein